jgi:hypothetical protein
MPDITQIWSHIVVIGVVGVGALLLGVVVARQVAKRLRGAAPAAEAFTIDDLCEMRRRGQITEQEYQAMRSVTIARMTRAAAPGGPESEPAPPDTAGDPPPDHDPEQR